MWLTTYYVLTIFSEDVVDVHCPPYGSPVDKGEGGSMRDSGFTEPGELVSISSRNASSTSDWGLSSSDGTDLLKTSCLWLVLYN